MLPLDQSLRLGYLGPGVCQGRRLLGEATPGNLLVGLWDVPTAPPALCSSRAEKGPAHGLCVQAGASHSVRAFNCTRWQIEITHRDQSDITVSSEL